VPLAADAILDVFREWHRVNLDSSLVTGIGQDQNMYGVREKFDYNEHLRFYYKRTKIRALTLFYLNLVQLAYLRGVNKEFTHPWQYDRRLHDH